jgi:rhamnosyltransferase subunit B
MQHADMTLPRIPKVVLATFGTHGDLHPLLALAIELQRMGVAVTLAAAPMYRTKVESEGIAFGPMRPDVDAVAQRLGLSQRELLRKVVSRPDFLIQNIILPHLRESYDDIMAITEDADLIVAQSAAYGARVAADKRGLPCIGVVLQPLGLMSIYDPPIIANVARLSRWIYSHGPRWTRLYLGLGRKMSRRWAQPIEDLRSQEGVSPSNGHPLFEGQITGERTIALFSPLFGAAQPDHPPNTSIVGFAFYDRERGGASDLDPQLESFLAAGTPPIVFTQGTSAVHDADDFVRESLAAIATLGARAVLVLDQERATQWSQRNSSSIFVSGYAPYSQLFPRASAIVHHGGVGTTAQALRSGKPQLIAPYLIDQPDNAERVARLGAGRVLPLQRYRARTVAASLRALLDDARCAQRAVEIGRQISAENGAVGAATLIVDTLRKRGRFNSP